jgi:protein-L-isoaspartate(D-aspartate) O-methyltransferase
MAKVAEPPLDYPPPGMEIRLIERYAGLDRRRILEIGSGDGRLTLQLARKASRVVALELDPGSVALARRQVEAEGMSNVSLRVGAAERLRRGQETFDVALFSWSL